MTVEDSGRGGNERSTNRVGHVGVVQLLALLQAGDPIQLLDVREPWEHADGVIEGAILMPMPQLQSRWQELDLTRPIAVICHLGVRSAWAAQFLARHGCTAIDVDEGMASWEGHGFPIVRPPHL